MWDHHNATVNICFPGYVKCALHKVQHPIYPRKQHAPHSYYTPIYSATPQITVPTEKYDPIDDTGTKPLQDVLGTLLYYGKAINSTMIIALGILESVSNTQEKSQAITHLLNYCDTHLDATVRFHCRYM